MLKRRNWRALRPLKTSSWTILSALEEADAASGAGISQITTDGALRQHARPIIIEDPDLALPFTRMLRARELRLAV